MRHAQAPKSMRSPAPLPAVDTSTPALVLLDAPGNLDAPLGVLTGLLAHAIAADFGDAVLVVHLAPEGDRAHPEDTYTDPGRVDRLFLPAPADPAEVTELLRARLPDLLARYDYIFLDTSARPAAFTGALAGSLGPAYLGALTRRLVYLTADRAAPPSPGWSVLRTDLLAPHAERPTGLEMEDGRVHLGVRRYLAEARNLAEDLHSRLGGTAIEPQGEPYPTERVAPTFCRARLDLPALAAQRPRDLSALSAAARQTLSRWARALTHRRVGVALGGSGSWGYAHVALLQELEARGVPVDILGASSSGSLMGAYYAVLGGAGLSLAVRRGPRFTRVAFLSTVTSIAIDLAVDADLGPVLLEDLEVVFLPVATNLSRCRAEVITRSVVGAAVRASSSAPGVFASTITRNGLYVDGAITDNVPVVLVERMGADLLLACNPLPPPAAVSVQAPGGPLDDFVAEFNPMNRIRDLAVSFALMFHDFGDCEDARTRVIYDPPPEGFPLFHTFDFHRAEEIVSAVKEEDCFKEMIRKSVSAYEALRRPRRARGGAG